MHMAVIIYPYSKRGGRGEFNRTEQCVQIEGL
jgi:hypothetical protein